MPQTSFQPNVENSGIVADQVTLTGEYVAGRDIRIEEKTFIYTQAKFAEVNLDPYKRNGEYIAPLFTGLLLNQALENHLLAIGGKFEFYKNDLIRHLAALIHEDKGLKAKEWVERAGGANPAHVLAEEKAPTIFLFPQTKPQELNYDLRRIAEIARKYGHFVLISTNLSEHSWKLPPDVRREHWFEIPQSHIYSPDDLTRCLILELEKAGQQNIFENSVERLYPNTELVRGISVEELASDLETVDKIQIFVRLLKNQRKAIDKNGLNKLLAQITNDNLDLITNWFLTLDEKEKETAIALSLFEGLYDDQFFEATERLVDETWEARETRLRSLDYCDLDSLFNFFNVQQVDANRRLIYSKFPNQRQEFFKAIWYSHRRKLLAALPTLESLIRNAGNITAYNWELYGTAERRGRLLEVVSEVLSDLSILHLRVVEPNLLRLATNKNIHIQEVTAKALARWRAFEGEKQLFETLERWREEMHIREIIDNIARNLITEGNQESQEEEPEVVPAEAVVRATIALTLAYASTYDEPNKLSKDFIPAFLEARKDSNEYVRERYRKVTVPIVVANHFWQLRKELFSLLHYADLIYSVAIGIARAYERFPDKVKSLIEDWLKYVQKYPQYRSSGFRVTHRDSVLITIILALAEMRFVEENTFNARSAYEIIRNLQEEEYHQAIEKYYFRFVLKQLDVHASQVDPAILDIIENLSYKRHDQLIKAFTQIYLNQRGEQKGGDITWQFGDEKYPIWLNTRRPLTSIEKTLMGWLLEEHPAGQQIALDALYQFGETFDLEEQLFIEQYQEKKRQNREPEKKTIHQGEREPVFTSLKDNWISLLIGWFTLGKYSGKAKAILANILPVLVRKKYTSEQNLELIAQKLQHYGNDDGQRISGFISRFAKYFNNFLAWRIFVIILLIILAFMVIAALASS